MLVPNVMGSMPVPPPPRWILTWSNPHFHCVFLHLVIVPLPVCQPFQPPPQLPFGMMSVMMAALAALHSVYAHDVLVCAVVGPCHWTLWYWFLFCGHLRCYCWQQEWLQKPIMPWPKPWQPTNNRSSNNWQLQQQQSQQQPQQQQQPTDDCSSNIRWLRQQQSTTNVATINNEHDNQQSTLRQKQWLPTTPWL